MHPTFMYVLEGVEEALAMAGEDGAIRFANRATTKMLGMRRGIRLPEGDLKNAVREIASGKVTQPLDIELPASGLHGGAKVRVMPSIHSGEAVLFAVHGEPSQFDLGLNNLLTVIRSDLSQPLTQLRGTLDGYQHESTDEESLGQVLEELSSVLDTLDKMVDLAELWNNGSLLADDRILLPQLIEAVWQDIAPLAGQRRVSVRVNTQEVEIAAVYGSEAWIRRVFQECLRSAVLAATPGSSIVVEYRQLGPRVTVIFRDCGLFAGKRQGGHAMTLSSAKKMVSGDELLGLHLCQRVMELHGGGVRLEASDSRHDFVLELPAGAPHRSTSHDLDVAQAQKYAEDFSRLLANRRNPSA